MFFATTRISCTCSRVATMPGSTAAAPAISTTNSPIRTYGFMSVPVSLYSFRLKAEATRAKLGVLYNLWLPPLAEDLLPHQHSCSQHDQKPGDQAAHHRGSGETHRDRFRVGHLPRNLQQHLRDCTAPKPAEQH